MDNIFYSKPNSVHFILKLNKINKKYNNVTNFAKESVMVISKKLKTGTFAPVFCSFFIKKDFDEK
jgi:hypothetical protein